MTIPFKTNSKHKLTCCYYFCFISTTTLCFCVAFLLFAAETEGNHDREEGAEISVLTQKLEDLQSVLETNINECKECKSKLDENKTMTSKLKNAVRALKKKLTAKELIITTLKKEKEKLLDDKKETSEKEKEDEEGGQEGQGEEEEEGLGGQGVNEQEFQALQEKYKVVETKLLHEKDKAATSLDRLKILTTKYHELEKKQLNEFQQQQQQEKEKEMESTSSAAASSSAILALEKEQEKLNKKITSLEKSRDSEREGKKKYAKKVKEQSTEIKVLKKKIKLPQKN